jgi:dTDP-4-dehydrorhamnose 3,5-epimerase-like enzyme
MAKKTIRISQLEEHSDQRGVSFSLPAANLNFMKKIKNIHFATILPGAVRGNHYHELKKEMMIVIYSDAWIFSYQEEKAEQPMFKHFEGESGIVIEIDPKVAHGIKNTGTKPLILGCFSNKADELNKTDLVRKVVV